MRNIPIVTMFDRKVVHTVNYKPVKYIGEPTTVVKILSDLGADEIFLFDITNRHDRSYKIPSYSFLTKIADQTQSPIAYGGGLSSSRDVNKAIDIIKCGYEKIVSARATRFVDSSFFAKLSDKVGCQSVVCCMEVGLFYDGIDELFISDLENYSRYCGEILVVDTNRNGTLSGINPEFRKIDHLSYRNIVVSGGANYQENYSDLPAVAASTKYILYQNNVMINYECNNKSALQ